MAQLSEMALLGKVLGESVGDFVNTTAQQAINGVMGHNANLASAQGQAQAANFNAGQANAATEQNIATMSNQYQYNASQAAMANSYNTEAWERAASWNEQMWEKQAAFNAEQAQIQRDWQESMSNTQYQRAMADMEKAGLNPILAYSNGGAGVPNGAVASVGGSQMSSAQANMASGGLLGAESGSISGYQGQMEFTGGVLNLLATALAGMSSAQMAMSQLGNTGQTFMEELTDTMNGATPTGNEYYNENGEKVVEYNQVGKFARKMSTDMKIATTNGRNWEEKKQNYYKNLANQTNQKRHKQSADAWKKYE